MDKLENYRDLIKNYINRHVEGYSKNGNAEIEEIAVCDDVGNHYQWLSTGWKDGKRNFYTHVYARFHNGKIYIEEDWTEEGLGNFLVENGVPKSDIVLAFQSPKMRELTEFALA